MAKLPHLRKSLISLWKKLKKYPFIVLGVLLGLLILTGAAANFTKKPKAQEQVPEAKPLSVQTITVGSASSDIEATGNVQNLSSITLVAQTSGPVNNIYLTEGKTFKKGAPLTSQETGYGVGNAAYIGVQIAEKNLQMSETSLKSTTDSVSLTRQLADKNRENTEELRKLSAESISGTSKIVDTTKQVIAKIESDLAATTDATIIQGLRQQLISYQNILVGAESQLRNLQYSTNTDKAPTQIATISKDQIYQSTQLQLDMAQLSKEIAELNVKSARLSASLSTLRAPFAGSVERIFVSKGQYLTPGTPVAKITGSKPQLCLVISVSGFSASRIRDDANLIAQIGDKQYSVPISHVSSTPTSGQLYEVLAVLPDSMKEQVYEGQSISVHLPTQASTSLNESTAFIPLDAVFVTNLETYVFILKEGKAVRTSVETGEIVGNEIEIKSGLQSGDTIIVDRRVIEGQLVIAEEKVQALPEVEYLFNDPKTTDTNRIK